ncbi:MAG: zinc metallopeptidase [Bacteroidales bacterium]|nr:zinc metallopeptidase [Bacteroidales bacterium]MDT8373263.1 neutral zinc metallopeptidase [Bacteroidales bacterium]
MKWQGRRGSNNIEDRRGLSTGTKVMGGGIGTLVIILLVMLLGGDPQSVIEQMDPGTATGPYESSEAEDQMAQFVSVVLADVEDVWTEIFRQSGATYREPTLVLFRDQVQSACGYATAASGPFYCPADMKVYIDLSFCDDLATKYGAQGDFAIAYVIAHEVGHHVQNLLGILDEVTAERQRLSEVRANQLTVRLELQADFFAGVWAHHASRMFNSLEEGDIEEALNAAASIGDDVLQKKYQGRVVPDTFTHGTATQRSSWLRKGWVTGDVSQGDTFSAAI